MAGHSRRFAAAGFVGPKAFLPIGDGLMIDHAVSMFAPTDTFHFVVTHDQAANPEHIRHLRTLAQNVRIVEIDAHELGPTHSALFVDNIECDDEVIVAYCDFTVRWDYEKFLRQARDYDAAAPCFHGFHPASFGHTFYAYVRHEGPEFLELREKRSFTAQRHEEFASTGIYYFKRHEQFVKYAREVLSSDKDGLAEAYVSLLLNPMVRDGQRVGVFPVDKFICLGTPEDVAQYRFWFSVFRGEQSLDDTQYRQANLMPMAGGGSRFVRAGFTELKPLVPVGGEPMFKVACRSFPKADQWIFLGPSLLAQSIPPEAALVTIDETTSGQAATCLRAEGQLDPSRPLFIASCDYRTDYDSSAWKALIEDSSIDVAIWTFRLSAQLCKRFDAFAYCRTDHHGRVIEVVEKQTISDRPEMDPMVIGTFWYRRAEDFMRSAKSLIAKDVRVNGEHYVGTSINQLIEKGAKVMTFDIQRWVSFGDPFERDVYEYWRAYFSGAIA